MHRCCDWWLYVIVSVGRSTWRYVDTVLADEAVFSVARLIIPFVTVFFPQIDACLRSTLIVRLTIVPVGVAHDLVSVLGDSGLFEVICRFPYKLGTGFGMFPLSCRPYVDSVNFTSITQRPLVICKHAKSTLLQLSKYISLFNIKCL